MWIVEDATTLSWSSAAVCEFVFRPTTGHLKVKIKERIVLCEIHFRTTGRHLSMGSHSVICHPTEVTFTPNLSRRRRRVDTETAVQTRAVVDDVFSTHKSHFITHLLTSVKRFVHNIIETTSYGAGIINCSRFKSRNEVPI